MSGSILERERVVWVSSVGKTVSRTRQKKELTDHDREEIRRRYRAGEAPLSIALDYGIPYETVNRILGIRAYRSREKADNPKKEKAIALHASGLSWEQVAQELGISVFTAQHYGEKKQTGVNDT